VVGSQKENTVTIESRIDIVTLESELAEARQQLGLEKLRFDNAETEAAGLRRQVSRLAAELAAVREFWTREQAGFDATTATWAAKTKRAEAEVKRLREALKDADPWLSGLRSLDLKSRLEHAIDIVRAALSVHTPGVQEYARIVDAISSGPTPSELRQRLFADANDLEAIARRMREYVPGVVPPGYPWTGTLSDKTRWTAVYESGVAEGRRLGRADVLSALRSGPPSGWCTYQIREGLAEEVANTIGLADGIVKEIKKEAGSSGV